ncbi:MAG: hypothetical protein HZA31_07055 [Opitutae bacterium]|nr:hypothetical protein [Opitutae bacterium]
MRPLLNYCRQGACLCLRGVGTCVLWTLWLALLLLLAVQIWIATSRELTVPQPVLRRLESQLANSQLAVRCGRATFDPFGRLLLEDFAISATGSNEPIMTGRLLYTKLDPWALLAGHFEARNLEIAGVDLYVPAMFSRSGQPEALVRELDVTLQPGAKHLLVGTLRARLGRLAFNLRGAVDTSVWRDPRRAALSPEELFARHYAALARQLAELAPRLEALETAHIDLELAPSDTRGAIVQAEVQLAGLHLTEPFPVQTGPLRFSTRFPLTGPTATMAGIDAQVESLNIAGHAARGVRVQARGLLRIAEGAFDLREADIVAAEVRATPLTLTSPVLRLDPGPLPKLRATLAARVADAPVGVQGDLDINARAGTVRFATGITPALIELANTQFKLGLDGLVQLTRPIRLEGELALAPGGKPERARGWIATERLAVQDVAIDAVAGKLEWQGNDFRATDAVMFQGESVARGTYTMDLASRDYRFLLKGRLRPEGINGWFTESWPNIWKNFVFVQPPDADADILGRWGSPDRTQVFLGATGTNVTIRTAPFDTLRTELFLWDSFNIVHALDFHVTRRDGEARGWFKRTFDPKADAWRAIDFSTHSTMDLQESAPAFGPPGPKFVAPYRFEKPPRLFAQGHLDGPATGAPPQDQVHIELESTGAFSFHGFPLRDIAFTGELLGDTLTLDPVRTQFAGGAVAGKARVWGPDEKRQTSFTATLRQAALPEAAMTLDNYSAFRAGLPPPSKNPLLDNLTNIKVDVDLAAEGLLDDILSYQGDGTAQLSGSELGQVPMLGLLSQLLPFTTLRFTAARAQFKVEGPRINFTAVRLTGSNSAIEAHGYYGIDARSLDFRAKVFPFEQSSGLIRGTFGLVFTPLSQFLEVKLTGNLARPSWHLLYSPLNILRSLAEPAAEQPKPAAPAPAPVPAAPPPAP